MNNNIRTMKRLRQTHAKFAALNHAEDGESPTMETSDVPGAGPMDVDDSVDERPWKVPEGGSGIEIGEERAGECLTWMSGKVLEHAGFQGLSFPFLVF
jgi:transcriptional activator SPT7